MRTFLQGWRIKITGRSWEVAELAVRRDGDTRPNRPPANARGDRRTSSKAGVEVSRKPPACRWRAGVGRGISCALTDIMQNRCYALGSAGPTSKRYRASRAHLQGHALLTVARRTGRTCSARSWARPLSGTHTSRILGADPPPDRDRASIRRPLRKWPTSKYSDETGEDFHGTQSALVMSPNVERATGRASAGCRPPTQPSSPPSTTSLWVQPKPSRADGLGFEFERILLLATPPAERDEPAALWQATSIVVCCPRRRGRCIGEGLFDRYEQALPESDLTAFARRG